MISKSNLLISRLVTLISRAIFSRISHMCMRERSTAHAEHKKGCFSLDFKDFLISLDLFLISRDFSRISWVFKALISDFFLSGPTKGSNDLKDNYLVECCFRG